MSESQLPDGGAQQPPEIGDGESGNPGGAGLEFLVLEDRSGGAESAQNRSEAHREYDGGAQQLSEIGDGESGNPGGAGLEFLVLEDRSGGAESAQNPSEAHREYDVFLHDHAREYFQELELPEQNFEKLEEFSERNLQNLDEVSGGQNWDDWGQGLAGGCGDDWMLGLSDLLAGQVNEEPTTIEDLPEDVLSYIVSLVYPLDRKEWMKCKLLRKSAVGQACYDNRFGKSGEKNIVKDLILLIDDEENLLDALKRRKVSRRRRKEVNSLAYTLEVLRRPFKGHMRYWTKKSMADLLNEPGAVKLW